MFLLAILAVDMFPHTSKEKVQ